MNEKDGVVERERAVRRREKEIKDIKRIEAVLKKANICRIGLSDADGPYIVPVCFGYRDRTLYFHCAPEGRKISILRRNARVCVEADTDVEFVPHKTACGWTLKYRSVIGFGSARILEDREAKREGLSVIMAHYARGSFQFPDETVDRTAVVRIELESLTGKQSGYGGDKP